MPVKLGVGYGEIYIGFNRRLINSDGTVTMLWSNSTQMPTWPVDPTIAVLLHLPVTMALIDRNIAILGMLGEPFLEIQMSMRARCPVQHCFFLGYTNGYYGYFPTIKAAVEGGYGAQSATTWVQVGAGRWKTKA